MPSCFMPDNGPNHKMDFCPPEIKCKIDFSKVTKKCLASGAVSKNYEYTLQSPVAWDLLLLFNITTE
jgi:hypothetical protein